MYLELPPHRRQRSTPMAGSFLQPQTSPLSMNRTLSTNSSSNRSSRGLTVGDEFEAPAEINSGAQEPKIEEDARKSDASIKTQEEDVLKGDDFLFNFIDVIVRSDLEAPIFMGDVETIKHSSHFRKSGL
ncbi:hypothetical protein L916_19636 [Phytophthora nicotianae]|uniref:Uncharacterized protein n=3 Tax=Phytophthora nicotianae TaxID=4792 RepID=W2HY21_PHYNI|nr:hypothetical protein L916_19636 [Phytophthora nicotianae]